MKKRVKHCIESCRFIHLFLCFVLVSGECSAFALSRTVVKLIMLHYSCFARKNVQLQALFCRLQNVIIIISKKDIQHLRASNKNGSPCTLTFLYHSIQDKEEKNYLRSCSQHAFLNGKAAAFISENKVEQ